METLLMWLCAGSVAVAALWVITWPMTKGKRGNHRGN